MIQKYLYCFRRIRSSQEATVSLYLNKDTKTSQLVQSIKGKITLSFGMTMYNNMVYRLGIGFIIYD